MGEEGCFICDKQRGDVEIPGGSLYEDELVYSSHGAIAEGESRTYLGVLFVEPRRHVAGLGDLTNREAERFGLVATRLSRALQAATHAERIYSAVLGHHVPHLHQWLVARYPGTPADLWGVRVLEWSEAPRGGADLVCELCDEIRAHLARDGS